MSKARRVAAHRNGKRHLGREGRTKAVKPPGKKLMSASERGRLGGKKSAAKKRRQRRKKAKKAKAGPTSGQAVTILVYGSFRAVGEVLDDFLKGDLCHGHQSVRKQEKGPVGG